MKNRKQILISSIAICLLLAACGQHQNDNPTLPDEEPVPTLQSSQAPVNTQVPVDTHAGTRSTPYEFTDEITLDTMVKYESCSVKYTLRLNEIWKNDKLQQEYPRYSLDNRFLIKGSIYVECTDTDDAIDFQLYSTYVTDSLNEVPASIQTYKPGELNNSLRNVYSGGTYDVIILSGDDGSGLLNLPYLKINYTDTENKSNSIWIAIPSESITEDNSDSNTEEDSDSSVEAISEMTSEELEAILLEQPMYVQSTKYVVQDAKYKALYPDMLQAVIKNNSGTDVKNAVIAFVAWDSNGFPVKIAGQYDFGKGAYIKRCSCPDVNMVDGATYGQKSGLPLDSDTDNIATFKAIVASYDDFDGNTWDNPYYDTWVALYEDKKLPQ